MILTRNYDVYPKIRIFFKQATYFLTNFPTTKQMINTTISIATIVAPTGVPAIMEINIPITAHSVEIIAEEIVTSLKLLKILIALMAGNIMSAEIKREPTRFIARTITIAMTTAIRKLYRFVFTPIAFAKVSSNASAKNLL